MSTVSHSNFDPFEHLDNEDKHLPPNRPFWTLDIEDDDEELLKWLTNTYETLRTHAQDRIHRMRRNLAAYRGIHMHAQDIRTREVVTRSNVPVAVGPRVVNNIIYDVVEQHVSNITKFKPAVTTMPANDEHKDKMNSKTADEVIRAFWYKEEIDRYFQDARRICRIMGEAYLFIEFDENKGKLHPDWVREHKNDKKKKRVKLVDDSGKQIIGADGNPLFIDKPVRIGDVCYQLVLPWDVFLQRTYPYKRCEYAIYREIMDIDDVRAMWPDKAAKLDSSRRATFFDVDMLTERQMMNQVEVLHFWHRGTANLDSGRHVVFTQDTILENEEHPYDHKDFPWRRFTDIDVPGQLNGHATVEVIRPMQAQHNNLMSMIVRNQALIAHPKWMVPRGSVKIENLGNDATIVQYQGPQAPILSSPAPTPTEIFAFMDSLEDKIGQLAAVHSVSRGEPPPGVKAGIALQFLDEQEQERSNSIVAKHNDDIKYTALKTLSVMGQKYDDDEGRLEDLLGPKKANQIKSWKFANLNDINDVRVQTSSALPHNKAARMQTLLDLKEAFPERISDDQALDMLEFGQSDKFIDTVALATRSAESENDELMQSGKTKPPEKFEDQLAHYRVHVRGLNEPVFRDGPKKNFEALSDHVLAHEMLMFQISQKNPEFLARILTEFPAFPLFFNVPEPREETQAQPQPQQGGGQMDPEQAQMLQLLQSQGLQDLQANQPVTNEVPLQSPVTVPENEVDNLREQQQPPTIGI